MADNVRKSQRQNPYTFTGARESPPKNRKIVFCNAIKFSESPKININVIRNNRISFSNFWSNPTCTPTRASIITGKNGYRTGVKGIRDELYISETTLQDYISTQINNKYASAIVGQWYRSGNNSAINPETFGTDYYAGLIRGAVDDYYKWQLREDGTTSQNTDYITEVFTDLSIDWVNQQSKPWFMWLAYNVPHTPFHVPTSNMHN